MFVFSILAFYEKEKSHRERERDSVFKVFQKFEQAKLGYGGLVFGLSHFSLLLSYLKKRCLLQKWSKLTQM